MYSQTHQQTYHATPRRRVCAACDSTWRCVSIPWSAGKQVTRGSAARLGNVRMIELRDIAGWAMQYQGVVFQRAIAPFRVLEHLPALQPGDQRLLIIILASESPVLHNTCARVLVWARAVLYERRVFYVIQSLHTAQHALTLMYMPHT